MTGRQRQCLSAECQGREKPATFFPKVPSDLQSHGLSNVLLLLHSGLYSLYITAYLWKESSSPKPGLRAQQTLKVVCGKL
jgi:hypothetical protein